MKGRMTIRSMEAEVILALSDGRDRREAAVQRTMCKCKELESTSFICHIPPVNQELHNF
jgi:hypothetical protein